MNPPFCWTFSELESGMLTLIIRTFHWKYDFCATLLSGNWSLTHYFMKLNWFMRTSDLLHEVNAIVLSINPLFFLNFLRTCFIHLRFQTDNKFDDIRLELIDAATSEFWWSLDKQCQVEQLYEQHSDNFAECVCKFFCLQSVGFENKFCPWLYS